MVLKPLPRKTVSVIKKTYNKYSHPEKYPKDRIRTYSSISPLKREIIKEVPSRLLDFFLRRKSADSRVIDSQKHRTKINQWGFRVRRAKINGEQVILKSVHDIKAKKLISALQKLVIENNKANPEASYTLQKPHAYAIGDHFIAMKEANYPTLDEIINTQYEGATRKQSEFITQLEKQTGFSRTKVLKNLDKTYYELLKNLKNLSHTKEYVSVNYPDKWKGHLIPLTSTNLLLVGFEKGKFVLVPLIDLY